MSRSCRATVIGGFLAGLLVGFLAYKGMLTLGVYAVLPQAELERIDKTNYLLEQENRRLASELSRFQVPGRVELSNEDLPYSSDPDAELSVNLAREHARKENKFLMVTFGANWCVDCRNLHRQLNSDEVAAYVGPLFEFVNVNVGKFNQNQTLAQALGISLSRGIPVAVFYDPSGKLIGNTNEGQLEPARRYTSKQILKFVRDIVERSRVVAPDAVN